MNAKLTPPVLRNDYRTQIMSAHHQLNILNQQIATLRLQIAKTKIPAELSQKLKTLKLELQITQNEIEHLETKLHD